MQARGTEKYPTDPSTLRTEKLRLCSRCVFPWCPIEHGPWCVGAPLARTQPVSPARQLMDQASSAGETTEPGTGCHTCRNVGAAAGEGAVGQRSDTWWGCRLTCTPPRAGSSQEGCLASEGLNGVNLLINQTLVL